MKDRHYWFLLIPVVFMLVLATVTPSHAGFNGFLRQYSGVTVCVGPFISMASANTPYNTSLTYDYAFISKNGAAGASKNDQGAISTSGASGFMYTRLNGTDTNTVGILRLYVQHADTLLVEQTYQVVSPVIYSALYESGTSAAASVYLPVDVKYVAGVTVQADTVGRMDVRNASGIVGSGVTVSDKTGFSLAANQDVRHVQGIVGSGVTLSSTAIVPSGVTVTGFTQAALADFFDTNSGTDYATAVAGSVVKEIADNAGGSALTEAGIASAVTNALGDSGVTVHHHETVALAEFFSVDAGAYAASNVGSVVKEIADNGGGSALTEAGIASAVTNALGESGVSISPSGTSRVVTQFIDESAVSPIAYHVWGKKISEPAAGAPSANPELQAVLRYLYFSWRNKAETVGSGVSTYADDGATIIYKFLHSDDGATYTKGEVAAP